MFVVSEPENCHSGRVESSPKRLRFLHLSFRGGTRQHVACSFNRLDRYAPRNLGGGSMKLFYAIVVLETSSGFYNSFNDTYS
jgi:hypothetical protein